MSGRSYLYSWICGSPEGIIAGNAVAGASSLSTGGRRRSSRVGGQAGGGADEGPAGSGRGRGATGRQMGRGAEN